MNSMLTVLNTNIRQDAEGRYCLNDCHKASGAEKAKQPANFLRIDTAKDLVAEIDQSSDLRTGALHVVNGGNDRGTYVVKELIYAYAMWINPAFHLKVIRAFDAMVSGKGVHIKQTLSREQQLASAVLLSQDIIREKHEEIAALRPQAEAFQIIGEAEGELGVRDVGREVKLGQAWVTETLLARKWACKQGGKLRPAHYGLEHDYVCLRASSYKCGITGETKVRDDFKVTRKGINRLAQIIANIRAATQAPSREMEMH